MTNLQEMMEGVDIRELNIGGGRALAEGMNLADLGFRYRVSDEARAEIEAIERRAMRVLTTAHLYLFGAKP